MYKAFGGARSSRVIGEAAAQDAGALERTSSSQSYHDCLIHKTPQKKHYGAVKICLSIHLFVNLLSLMLTARP